MGDRPLPVGADTVIDARTDPWDEPNVPESAYVNVQDEPYGARGDGTTDDTAACQAALDAVIDAGGGVLLFPPGDYYLNGEGLELDATDTSATQSFVFSGYGATISMGPDSEGFLHFTKTADHNILRNVIVEGFGFDGTAMTASLGYKVIGNKWPSCPTTPTYNVTRMGADGLVFRDLTMKNMPSNPGMAGSKQDVAIWISCSHIDESEATQDVIQNILVENVHVEGCDGAVIIVAQNSTGYTNNVWMDNIVVRGCYHDRVLVEGYAACNSFHIGSSAYGGTCTIEDCIAKNSGDVAFEVNGFAVHNLTRCYGENSNNAFTVNFNFNPMTLHERQVLTFRDCHYLCTIAAGTGGFSINTDTTNGTPMGTVIIDGCSYTFAATENTQNEGIFISPSATANRISIRDFHYYSESAITAVGTPRNAAIWADDDGDGSIGSVVVEGLSYEAVCDIDAGTPSFKVVYWQHPEVGSLVLRDISYKVTATTTPDSALPIAVDIVGSVVMQSVIGELIVDGLTWLPSTGGTATYGLYIGTDAYVSIGRAAFVNSNLAEMQGTPNYVTGPGGTKNLATDRIDVGGNASVTAPAPAAVTVTTTRTVDSITAAAAAVVQTTVAHNMVTGDWCFISASNSTPDIDGWQRITRLTATTFSVAVTTTGAGNSAACQPALTNRNFYDEDLVVTGGTVTKIELSRDSATTFTDTGLTAGVFNMRPGDLLCITSSSAPTVTKVPRP